jgi:hypothetical protein
VRRGRAGQAQRRRKEHAWRRLSHRWLRGAAASRRLCCISAGHARPQPLCMVCLVDGKCRRGAALLPPRTRPRAIHGSDTCAFAPCLPGQPRQLHIIPPRYSHSRWSSGLGKSAAFRMQGSGGGRGGRPASALARPVLAQVQAQDDDDDTEVQLGRVDQRYLSTTRFRDFVSVTQASQR